MIIFGNSNNGDTDKRLFCTLHTRHKMTCIWYSSITLRCHEFLPYGKSTVCRIGRTGRIRSYDMQTALCGFVCLVTCYSTALTSHKQHRLISLRSCELLSRLMYHCAFGAVLFGRGWPLSLHAIVEYDMHSAVFVNYRQCEAQSLLMTLTYR
jgi:hypothetical protein